MPQRPTILTNRQFQRFVVAAVALGFLALVAAGVAAALSILENQRHSAWVNHTYQVERQISQFRIMMERAEAAHRGLLLTGSRQTLATFEQASGDILPAIERLRRLTADNPRQQALIRHTLPLVRADVARMRRSIDMVTAGRREQAVGMFVATRGYQLMRQIRGTTEEMVGEEDRLLRFRSDAQHTSVRSFFIILSVAGVLLVLVGGGSIWVILRYTRDLTASRAALQALNNDLEGAVRERTVDLQRANDEIQRFAYIVSHDLRSPLVNVMGFTAELETSTAALRKLVDKVEEVVPDKLDPAARDAAREDLPEAIGFIRTSTQKMDRLINAILRLSREGRRPITPERLDMDALFKGIADTLKHRTDQLGIEVMLQPGLPTITSDRLAIEQIFSNLIENATKYLRAGVPGRIEVSGRRDGARAIFAVADNGRGIDPRDHERVFDLFRRSGVQDQPGEGIGLAHTRALAYRLGGTIAVESALDEGATFHVNVPAIFTGEMRALS